MSVSFKSNFTSGSISVKAVSLCGGSVVKTINVNKCTAAARQSLSEAPKEMAALELNLYPNPSKGNFTLFIAKSNNKIKAATISIVNAFGQSVYQQTAGAAQVKINQPLANGLYFVRCTVDGETTVKKMVINH